MVFVVIGVYQKVSFTRTVFVVIGVLPEGLSLSGEWSAALLPEDGPV